MQDRCFAGVLVVLIVICLCEGSLVDIFVFSIEHVWKDVYIVLFGFRCVSGVFQVCFRCVSLSHVLKIMMMIMIIERKKKN